MTTIAPAVRKLARELNVNLDDVKGTGKNGAIKIDDVRAHAGVPIPEVTSRARDEGDTRAPLHHLMDQGKTKTVGGMSFKRPDRGALDHSLSKQLDIPEKYKNNDLVYRWVTDDGGRVEQLRERLGYEAVPNIKTPEGDTITTRRRTGTNKDGSPQYQQLMATPKEWKRERDIAADETLKVKERGRFKTPTDDKGNPLGGDFYMRGETEVKRV